MGWKPLPELVEIVLKCPNSECYVLDPVHTALVIVDMQNYFCTPGFGMYRARMHAAVEGIANLLEKARSSGATVIYVQSIRRPEMDEFVRFGRQPHLIEGTPDVEIVTELLPRSGEPLIRKHSHDPFARTDLEKTLTRSGIVEGRSSVLVTGVSTAVCLNSCALGFANRNFYTIIPMDCTGSSTEADEMRTYDLFSGPAYSHCIGFSTSDRVTFAPGVGELKPRAAT